MGPATVRCVLGITLILVGTWNLIKIGRRRGKARPASCSVLDKFQEVVYHINGNETPSDNNKHGYLVNSMQAPRKGGKCSDSELS